MLKPDLVRLFVFLGQTNPDPLGQRMEAMLL